MLAIFKQMKYSDLVRKHVKQQAAEPALRGDVGAQKSSALRRLLGTGKQLWAQWGGGESFLEQEHTSFENKAKTSNRGL